MKLGDGMGLIYIATNRQNGKQYVGQTVNFRKRIATHKAARRYHFDRALNKYGIENFDFQLIAYKREELNEWERYFINKLNTVHPNGYNHTSGGNAKCQMSAAARKKLSQAMSGRKNPFYGRKHSEETRRKIRENHPDFSGENHPQFGKPHKMSIGDRLKRTIMMRGEGNSFFGKHHSEATKAKLRAFRTGTTMSQEVREKIRQTCKKRWRNQFTGAADAN